MKVYFMLYEKANFASVLPVMRALRTHPRLRPAFIKGFDYKEFSGQITPFVIPQDIDASMLDQFVCQEDLIFAEKSADRWLRNIADAASSQVAELLFRSVFQREYSRAILIKYFENCAALTRFADQVRPDAVILPEDTDYIRGRPAARIFKEKGVRVFVQTPNYYAMFDRYPLAGPRYADHYLAPNQHFAQRLTAAGVAPGRVEVPGNPAFDQLCTVPETNANEPTYLFALQGAKWEREVFHDLRRAMEKLNRALLLIKPHPEIGIPNWLAQEELPAMKVLAPTTAIEPVLGRCCALLAQSSTLLYQALALGKEIIVPHYGYGPLEIYLPAELAARACVTDYESLLRRLCSPPEPLPEIRDLTTNTGNATAAVVGALERLLLESALTNE